jgi:hypothetical protein
MGLDDHPAFWCQLPRSIYSGDENAAQECDAEEEDGRRSSSGGLHR